DLYGSVSFAGLDPSLADSGKEYSNMTGQSVKPVSMIIKDIGSAGADDPLNQRGTVAWKAVLDVEVLNANWIRNLYHVNVFSDE
ncbi:MAG: hypothetical protein KJ556_20585, partial [Gammaproteobacteria bacterium]|nr:hypothetical protein [Gammaproteobacteria bacterium]